jgi:hypothetical protein
LIAASEASPNRRLKKRKQQEEEASTRTSTKKSTTPSPRAFLQDKGAFPKKKQQIIKHKKNKAN